MSSPVSQYLINMVSVMDSDKQASWPSVDHAVLLTS